MVNYSYFDHGETRWTLVTPTMDDPTLVVCPSCEKQAKVLPSSTTGYRLICAHCGFLENQAEPTCCLKWQEENPTDGHFGYALWLKTTCCGQTSWAFNQRHLDILESFVSAKLRQRRKDQQAGWKNSSLASRFPKWLKASKNRAEVMKAIIRLRKII